MLATPDLPNHINENIYEPAEDSFLFLDVLEDEMNFLRELDPVMCVEIGPGSGIITAFVGKHLKDVPCHFVCVDVNFDACSTTLETASLNAVPYIDAVSDNLGTSFLPQLERKVDLILFNPPYVVTPSNEVCNKGIAAAWAGGVKGREVTDRFLPVAAKLLSDKGVFYLLLCSDNEPEEVISLMKELGFNGITMKERKAGREKLSVVKFYRCR